MKEGKTNEKGIGIEKLAKIFEVPIEMLSNECEFDIPDGIMRDIMKSCHSVQDAIIKSQLLPKE